MLIRIGYDIEFDVPSPVAMVTMLRVHPSRAADLHAPDDLHLTPSMPIQEYVDGFGNVCSRFVAPVGVIQLHTSTLIDDPGVLDPVDYDAIQHPVQDLPSEVLQFLLASRYCEVDTMSNLATQLFGSTAPGWERVRAICGWVYEWVSFGYNYARPTKTAQDVYNERAGVCRDFQHLAITFCRCMNVPARYATGYLGDIGIPPTFTPMDFSAWFEVYLGGRWWSVDARHNARRIGRILMGTGRDAADVAITTSFGYTRLTRFDVVTDEVIADNGTKAEFAAMPLTEP